MENREKAVNLFKYIMELHALKYPITMDISKQEWYKFVCNLEEDKENIKINYIDRNSENIEENNFLVEIVKPEFEENPKLPKELENWLEDSWNDYRNNLTIISEKIDKNSEIVEKFEDKKERMEAFEKFKIKHKLWSEKQKVIENTRNLFSDLYLKYIELQRDSETLEFVLGQGFLECENEKKIKHPILLKRVALEFDALNNKIKIVDTDTESEIYTGLLQNIDFINHSVIKNFKNELEENFYHPFEKTETSNFLKSLTHSLHPESQYIEKNEENKIENNRLIIKNAPVFFIRKRTSGVVKSIEEIIKELEEGKEISGPLLNLIGESVSQYSDAKREESISESLASMNGEDKNILLSKEANREQLEIAKKIEDYNAVLVQGPPGTGKTHTIANLIGHFLAHGKNVLVTSHTKKALSVVKEKLNPELQNLCVSILDDNNRDMEQSIDGITEYIATHGSLELFKKSEELKNKRENIIDELNKVRKDLFDIKLKEFEPINIDGEFFNPTQAAKFIFDNTELIDCIPGKMNIDNATLINPNDIEFLYKTNEFISPEEEKELGSAPMPQLEFLIKPEELEELINEYDSNLDENKNILRKLTDKKIELDYKNKNLIIAGKNLSFFYDKENLKSLKNFLKETKIELETFEDEWQAYAILDGKTGGGYKNIWLSFAQKIESAYNYAGDNIGLTLGKQISGILDKTNSTLQTLNSMKEHLLKGKKINSFSFFKPKDWIEIYEKIRIDGHTIDTVNDCETLISFISLSIKREELSRLWYELIEKKNGPAFKSLGSEPELKAINYVAKIKNCIEWYETNYRKMQTLIEKAGLNIEILLSKENLDMNPEELKHMLKDIYLYLPMYIDLLTNIRSESNSLNSKYEDSKNFFTVEQLETSSLYKNLFDSLEKKDVKKYSENYKKLEKFYEKETYITERQRILKIIKAAAPKWAEEIKNRKGIHGHSEVPTNLVASLKLKKLNAALENISSFSFEETQNKAVSLSKELRKISSELAENLAWYNLFLRIEKDISQKQALQGWKLTVKKIGKGTGKTAPSLRREAKKLMAKCQMAVPAWVMPVNKALENLDPKVNKFDIVIIDEASQSDISALAILYLAKKIIIVGDDEQVSPSAVGLDINKMTYLSNMYIKGLIPNSHLYDMKSSLYDIAKTTFPTLMLREHFRCVPDIINYSNRLSYENKIKALRDDSFVPVKPATISYYVKNAIRDNKKKINEKEAEMIVALMKACMEFEEYKNMSFGAISLLGDEQANKINSLAVEKISPLEYEKRKILCGNASQFQGDERDIIFISLVDSNDGESQLRITGEGSGKATKQRYNVAVSRAKNQLWIVHSLDITKDLKLGDMRRDLIEYAENPKKFREITKNTNIEVDSQLEIAIFNELKKLGYNLIQDWRVGSYRIDMVVVDKNKKIAIECDGDFHNSGKERIKADMEKQSVLERLGWKFIRIRGSEYYRNPAQTLTSICKKLKELKIEPQNLQNISNEYFLKEKIIARAEEILSEWSQK